MERRRLRIAVFASGSGSNFQAIMEKIKAGELSASAELLVCDRPEAPVVEKARKFGVPTFVFRAKDYPSREAYEKILQKLNEKKVELVVLAGYMRLLTETLVKPYEGRMINIHPSLLPAFPGMDGIGQALRYGVKVTGVTVHFVDHGMDTGPIIAQRVVEVKDDDDENSLAERIHAVEHELYPFVIEQFARGKIHLSGRKVTMKPYD